MKNKISFGSIDISCHTLDSFVDLITNHPSKIVTFINPSSYNLLKKDDTYRNSLLSYDCIFADGGSVSLVSNLINVKEKISRISFDSTSLAPLIFQWCESNKKTVCFVGSEPGVAFKALQNIKRNYPNLNVVRCFSGYGDDPELASKYIIDNEVDVVVCSMGAPRQEAFLVNLKELGWPGTGFTCGGYFDQSVESYQYYPELIDKLNIRFLYRLYKEPRRLWRRYLVEYNYFYLVCFKEVLNYFRGRKND